MPITIKPSPNKVGLNYDRTVTTEDDLYDALVDKWEPRSLMISEEKSKRGKRILHSSFKNLGIQKPERIVPYGNGFVEGVMRAFQQDLHLVLRPDDVWLAITAQSSFYVNRHAEKLRTLFVAHEGKEELVVFDPAPFRT
jgi:hypothetical protein